MKVVFNILCTAVLSCSVFLLLPATNASPMVSQAQISQSEAEWKPPRFEERRDERHQMVKEDIARRGVSDSRVLDAMRHVPRHEFVPGQYQEFAYDDRPLPIGHAQTISQPFIVGYMTQMLDLQAGEKVLEIGTGSGYQAAVLSEITPHVFTIEIVAPLGQQARSRFDQLGYSTIQTKIGDGYRGWPKQAPFDAIIMTAAPETIPQPLIDQLKPGGVLVAPVGAAGQIQTLTRVTKSKEGKVRISRELPVRFVPMTRDQDSTSAH
ncbi:protein-L-isoaspartate(D-aspartate) O-methyltransferase [Fodinibius sediminis]|uniref:Protein-L-isoaspartate O-methyltransferase n=1 Tax=Fodinibius sediminis TaxID=1214077 RepID=A0A521DNI0_9BACT|nr:protein-L-isoaspartate(D-aspartate) O-methyltransferase [Fodinibius sediminis]SMO72621.1 protein-L-isoaspartate(D-aspartate) O-methyltransferase [Fodinibius sediminis]